MMALTVSIMARVLAVASSSRTSLSGAPSSKAEDADPATVGRRHRLAHRADGLGGRRPCRASAATRLLLCRIDR